MATKKYEVYHRDDINSIRSFMGKNTLSEFPRDLPPRLGDMLIQRAGIDAPDGILIMLNYVEALRLINAAGYHLEIPIMMSRLYDLSQEYRNLDFTDPKIQRFILTGYRDW